MFKDGILGMIPVEDYKSIGWTPTRPQNPVDQLVGDESTPNLVVRWQYIASEFQIPVMAQFHAFDVETQKTVRKPIESASIEKGFIKVKNNTSELLREAIMHGTPRTDEAALYEYVMNDNLNLAEQVDTRTKVAKNEMLATGAVTIKENDLDLTVDYGVPAANKALTLDFGEGATDPVADQLQTIVETARAAGQAITGMYTSSAVLSKLRRDLSLQKAINGVNMQGVLLKRSDVLAYLDDEYGISQVVTNDQQYSLPYTVNANGRPVPTMRRYYPQDKVTFFAPAPNGQVGTGLWGVPPEVDIASFGGIDVSTSSLNGFVYISQWAEKDPAVIWTKASGLFMPVLYNPTGLYIASVTETQG